MRHLLLIVLFLLAQAGALVHGAAHLPEQIPGDEPVCELCLAYAPMGAGVASTPLVWSTTTHVNSFDVAVPAASPIGFQPIYQSRAPPRLHK